MDDYSHGKGIAISWDMDAAYVTALAALGGAALGGFTSFATSWTNLRLQMRAEQTANSKSARQELYKKFIDEASRIYGDALIHNTLEMAGLIELYALISRMRVLSSRPVADAAVDVAKRITDTYRQPNKTPEELEAMIFNNTVDLLEGFSDACRREFEINILN